MLLPNKVYEENADCPDEKKSESIELALEILRIRMALSVKGLLHLGDDKYRNSRYPFLLRRGFRLLAEGTDPGEVRKILEVFIMAGEYTGCQLLYRTVILIGVTGIQAELPARELGRRDASLLGAEFQRRLGATAELAELK